MLLIFDENYPPDFVKGFAIIESANKRSVIQVDIIFVEQLMNRLGAKDEEIIEMAKEKQAVIVTHDSDFRRIKHYQSLLIKHKVSYIYFKVPKGKPYHYWDIVTAFVNKWDELKEKITSASIPFAFEISRKGEICKLDF